MPVMIALSLALLLLFVSSCKKQPENEASPDTGTNPALSTPSENKTVPESAIDEAVAPAVQIDSEAALWTRIEQLQQKVDQYNQARLEPDASREQRDKYFSDIFQSRQDLFAATRQYYAKYPQGLHARGNLSLLVDGLYYTARDGSGSFSLENQKLLDELMKHPDLASAQNFRLYSIIYSTQRSQLLDSESAEQTTEILDRMENPLRELIKKYPDNPQGPSNLLNLARAMADLDTPRAQKILNELVQGTDENLSERATDVLQQVNLLGNPLEIQFTALDGQEIDLANYKGKVVLIDFWATWCGPCVAEIPDIKAIYEKYHDQGFEIIGISFDSKKEALEEMIAEKKMPWPQYFDGTGPKNKFGQSNGIFALPTMWLVGKDGNVAYLNARSNLEQKVAKLLDASETKM